jgi:uncharacterized protein (TIGR02266 family)
VGGGKTFLVVDDVRMFRELEGLFLSRYGRVLEASCGEEALEVARREPLDLVVLDLHLPDMDGALVCHELVGAPATANTPLIVVAGRTAEDHARAIRAGAWDVLAKPLSRISLVETALRFIEGPTPRGLPRAEVEAAVRIVAAGTERWGVVRNVSRGGLFIEADWAPPGGAEMQLEFALPGARSYAPSARVVWERAGPGTPPGMGVRFVAIDRESSRRLDSFVHERGARPRSLPWPQMQGASAR